MLFGVALIAIIWAISYIPGLGIIGAGTEEMVEFDFVAKDKASMMVAVLAEKDDIQNMELFGTVISQRDLPQGFEERMASVIDRTEGSYISLVNSSGDVVWETGKAGEYLFTAEVPLPGGEGKRGEVSLG